MLIVFFRYITYYSLIFLLFVNKCENMNRMNEKWNYTLHEYYYVYGILYSRLESK